ncbi:two-component system, sensor histidine kinase YesM [Cohnella sp. OV330]|uniref:sensor histidine kinase n=1 Tax=Cohnella sp. OV330 TaxID=1855288 RepID=UPI0008ECD12D|nr:sensor histidine kinase [Cohnella sp. OV330]SFB56369.1 two-component system, sensor histidine kinase YesM [Cohnella sp. OV330]
MRMKIRTKIMASAALVVSLSLAVSGFFIYDYARNIIRDQSIKDSRTKLAQISFQLGKIQEQVAKTAEYIVSDEEIADQIYGQPGDSIESEYFRKQAVQEKLGRFVALGNFILNVLIVPPSGETYSNFSGYEDYFADYLKQDWFAKLAGERSAYSEPHSFFYISGQRQVVSYVLKYRPIGINASADSYLVIDVAYSELSNVFLQTARDFEQIELYSGQGALLYAANEELPAADRDFMARALGPDADYAEDDSRIALADGGMNYGWRQTALLSKHTLFEKINRIFYFYVLIILCGIVASTVVMLPIIVGLTRPLIRLTNAMKRVAVGDLGTTVDIRSGDELEILGGGFNRMVGDLKETIQASVRSEADKRQMQIDLLMAQINPHFLYNALNTVIYLSHAGRSAEAAEVTQALIAILQDTIKTGEGAVRAPLADEKRIVDKYAVIQQTRYPGRFRLIWEADEALLPRSVPRMALQPLVENAILHGIVPSDAETGTITLRAYRDGPDLCLEVEDDGLGMTLPAAGWLPRGGAGHERTRGIGLSNIQERLRSHFGARARLEVESEPGHGTLARIRLPWTEPG